MSGVRGPNSALTEFLRSQGINANEIKRRHEVRKRAKKNETEELPEDVANESIEEEEIIDPEIDEIAKIAADRKSGEFNEEHAANEGTSICANCNTKFTLTVYSRLAPQSEDSYLCRYCSAETALKSKKTKKEQGQKKPNSKKRKKMAADILALRFLVPPSLQDMCISTVAENIDSIDKLGELSVSSYNKISRILSKNRRLNSKTMQLFLSNSVKSIEFWDCSKFSAEAFNLIPAICPDLEKLSLGMCGQLNDENIGRFAQLPNLKEIYLDGPFLIRKNAWMEFFSTCGEQLTHLAIESVYRVDEEVLALICELCPNLQYLHLDRLCELPHSEPFSFIANLKNLEHLIIRDLQPEAWSDEWVVHVLGSIGPQLQTLCLKTQPDALSDTVLKSIEQNCRKLQRLELINFMNVSNEALHSMLESMSKLVNLSLERCVQAEDDCILTVIENSFDTLETLNLNSLKNLSPSTIDKLSTLPNLTNLDVGFVGRIDPKQIYKLSMSKSLKVVKAFGNIRLSGMALPPDLVVLGTM